MIRQDKAYRQAEKLVAKHLLPKWGKLQAAHIVRGDVKAMMTRIEAPIVANQTLAAASAIFSWAIKEEVAGIKLNPCSKVDRTKANKRSTILDGSEIPKFWTAFDDDYVRGLALKMILLTGQRPGEVQCMRAEHISADGLWSLPGKPIPSLGWPGTTDSRDHWVWLPTPAKAILAELNADGLYSPVLVAIRSTSWKGPCPTSAASWRCHRQGHTICDGPMVRRLPNLVSVVMP